MAVKRQSNFLGQQRVDVPHLRAMESAVAADFDALGGVAMAGNTPLVLSGFQLSTATASGAPAAALEMVVASGVILHPTASESGTILAVSDDADVEVLSSTNPKVTGAFVAGVVNYVAIDLTRTADAATSDLVKFLDPTTLSEIPRTVPLGRVLDFKIVITTLDPSALPHLCPIAKVTTDAGNNVSAITDIRPMMFRLALGGSAPNIQHSFPWSGGRQEGVSTSDAFDGGDKVITSLKAWQDAVMTRLWELGGGDRWYSASSDREVKLVYGQPVLGNGDNFQWTLGTNTVQWTSLQLAFCNSPAVYNTITNGTSTLLDGECLYVDVNRSTDAAALTMQRAVRSTLGAPTIPGSRVVIAWRRGNEVFFKDKQYEAGRSFAPVASTTTTGTVKLSATALNPADPIVVPLQTGGSLVHTALTSGFTGAHFTGNGSGAGVRGDGGATGVGVRGLGGATSGVGGQFIGGTGSHGLTSTGEGAGHGGSFTGGATDGTYGVTATSGATNGNGIRGIGTGTGTGVRGEGGGGVAAVGVDGVGGPGGAGVRGTGGASTGPGVLGQGTGTGAGVEGTSSTTAGSFGVLGRATGSAEAAVRGSGGVATSAIGVQGSGSGNSAGVEGTGAGTGAGVHGITSATGAGPGVRGAVNASATNGDGVEGTGKGTGVGVRAIAGGTGVAIVANVNSDTATGGVEINAPNGSAGTTAAINNSTDLLKLRNLRNVNGSICMISMLHADATSARDGWTIYTERIADGDVDLFLRPVIDGVLSTTTGLKFDANAATLEGRVADTHNIGSSAVPFRQVTTRAIAMPPVGPIQITGTNMSIAVGATGLLPVWANTATRSISKLTGGVPGQVVVLYNSNDPALSGSGVAIQINQGVGANNDIHLDGTPVGGFSLTAQSTLTLMLIPQQSGVSLWQEIGRKAS